MALQAKWVGGGSFLYLFSGNTKVGSITVPLTSCLTDSKPVKQEVNGTVILPPLVFPAFFNTFPVPVVGFEPSTSEVKLYPDWGLYYKTFYGRNLQIFVIS